MDINLTSRQTEALRAINDAAVVDVLYGGAKGGGKTVFLCCWAYWLASQIIEQFSLKPSSTPPHVGFIGRKQSVDFTMTTLQTWQEIIPQASYVIHGATDRHPKHILIEGRVAIDFGGFDRQETVNKFNSAEYVFIGIDQAEELTQDDVSVLRASRRMKLGGKQLRYKGLFTANPAPSWLKPEFIDAPAPQNRFVQALPSDNPYLPTTYVGILQEAFKHRPELLQAYLYGSWEAIEEAAQIIKYSWLSAAKVRLKPASPIREYLVCDPARFGDDETVIYRMIDAEIADKIILPYCKTTEISNRLARESRQHGDCMAVVESIGADLGAGVLDELEDLGVPRLQFNPAGAASRPDKYYNLRAEAWDTAARCLCDGVMPESNCLLACRNMYTLLESQLCAPCYKFRGMKLLVEAKEDIKKRIGRSPDHGDAYVIGLWAWRFVTTGAEDRVKAKEYRLLADKYRSPWLVRFQVLYVGVINFLKIIWTGYYFRGRIW